MKVTIDFGPELDPIIQEHLETGTKVQLFVRAAVGYFNKARQIEKDGKMMMGWGDAARFKSYNHQMSPNDAFNEISEGF